MSFSAARIRSAAVAGVWALVAVLLGGCDDDGAYPRTWAPLRAPAEASGVPEDAPAAGACPDLTGLYRANDSVIFRHLVVRAMTGEQREIDWYSVDITGSATDSLRAIVARNELRDTVWLARGRHFDCARGWLTATWPEYLLRMRPGDVTDESRGYTSRLVIARDTEGRLIGRMTTVSYKEFAVWCGDGCRYAKLPFTREESVRWHRMSLERTADADGGEPMFDSVTNARLAREEAALEAGTPPPGDARGGPAQGQANPFRSRAEELERRVENGETPRP